MTEGRWGASDSGQGWRNQGGPGGERDFLAEAGGQKPLLAEAGGLGLPADWPVWDNFADPSGDSFSGGWPAVALDRVPVGAVAADLDQKKDGPVVA